MATKPGEPTKVGDPINFLTVQPFCAYPHMKQIIKSLGLSGPDLKKMLVEIHRFEHTVLAAAHQFYAAVGQTNGAKMLDGVVTVLGEEYPKFKAKKKY